MLAARSKLIRGRFISVESPDVREFILHDNSSVWEAADELARLKGESPTTLFAKQETHAGLTYHPEGILWDIPLRRFVRPISAAIVDWMHV